MSCMGSVGGRFSYMGSVGGRFYNVGSAVNRYILTWVRRVVDSILRVQRIVDSISWMGSAGGRFSHGFSVLKVDSVRPNTQLLPILACSSHCLPARLNACLLVSMPACSSRCRSPFRYKGVGRRDRVRWDGTPDYSYHLQVGPSKEQPSSF